MLKYEEYVCLVFFFFVHLFVHSAISPSVSVTTLKDADAIYENINTFEIKSYSLVTEADIKPGVVLITRYRMVDGIKWGMAPTIIVAQNSI